jgi:hypothetical protein
MGNFISEEDLVSSDFLLHLFICLSPCSFFSCNLHSTVTRELNLDITSPLN